MPSNNPPATSQQPNNRRSTTSARVVPAIPLALSRPKASKQKQKPESDAQGGAGSVSHEVQLAAEPQQAEPVLNGMSPPQTEAETSQHVENVLEAVTMPAVDTPGSHGSAAMSLSFGGTPEMPTTDSPRPFTPDQTETQSSASPASSRRPTDRLDMRSIRTELPPAFIPSAEQHTPKSAGSSHSNRPLSFRSNAATGLPSTSSIVFGSQDSLTSSPVPPPSAGSTFAPPPYQTFGSTQQPHFVPQGHAHHASEPYAHRSYHSGYAQSGAAWSGRYGQPMPQAPMFHPHAHMPFRYPPRDVATPAEPRQVNGHLSRSRSRSQASSAKPVPGEQSPLSPGTTSEFSKPIPSEVKVAGRTYSRQPQYEPQMPPPPLHFQHPDIAASIANAEAIRDHVLLSWSNSDFSDCQLRITDGIDDREHYFNGHKLILSRSPALLSLLQDKSASSSDSSTSEVDVQLKGRYLRTSTFLDTVKYMYGGPMLQLDHQRPGSSSGEHIGSNTERMETALQYIATGAWLKVDAIAHRGIEAAIGILHWDTISNALTFALDGGLSHIWNVDDGSEDRISISSSDDSLSRSEIGGLPTYDPFSTILLQRIVHFIVHVLPTNFYLSAAAPQLASCPRLPSLPAGHETRPSRSDPRLSQIRFGDMVDDHQRPSFATTTVSSVLLSLPFQILKCVLEHYGLGVRLGPDTLASIMRTVVAEREARRTKALNARATLQSNGRTDIQLVQNLYWEEVVESSGHHRAGFRLARRKRDIDTPPSSGACSERNK